MKYFERFFQPQGWQEKTFTAKDGASIRYAHLPAKGAAVGTVIITTGYADYVESYYETMQDYADRGYDVWIMDWAGQGGSSKRGAGALKAYGVEDHMQHLQQFRHEIVTPVADKPVILSTHSLGGQVALNYLRAWPRDFDAAILAAPLVDFGLSPVARAMLSYIFRSAVGMGWRDAAIGGGRAGIQRQAISQRRKTAPNEPVRIDLHRTFFLLAKPLGAEDPSVALIDSLFKSTMQMNEEVVLKSIQTPVLIGLAGTDYIVNNDAIRRAAATIPGAKLVELPKATHGIWQESAEIVKPWWAAVDSFLAEQHNRKPKPPVNPPPKP